MSVILSLETSTDVCSVALYDGKRLLGDAILHEPQAHAARLAPLIDEIRQTSGLDFGKLDAVAVSKGPGSYTGLRIGTSTAKGLCYALDIPLIAVGTLELMAYQATTTNLENALLCPMIDARRMEVYCMITDATLNVVEPVAARIVNEATFQELLEHNRVLFFGNGAAKCRDVVKHSNAAFLDGVVPLAKSLGEIAVEKYARGEFEDLVGFRPMYLKEFVAKKAGSGI